MYAILSANFKLTPPAHDNATSNANGTTPRLRSGLGMCGAIKLGPFAAYGCPIRKMNSATSAATAKPTNARAPARHKKSSSETDAGAGCATGKISGAPATWDSAFAADRPSSGASSATWVIAAARHAARWASAARYARTAAAAISTSANGAMLMRPANATPNATPAKTNAVHFLPSAMSSANQNASRIGMLVNVSTVKKCDC